MSMLRILRNLAVLLIFAIAVLASTPRPVAATLACQQKGEACGLGLPPCCSHLVCEICNIGRGRGTCIKLSKNGGC
jgi:hypothetical protein